VEKPSCNQCIKLLELYNKEPNCLDCMPITMQENEAAFRVYELVEDQVITAGMSGEIIGLIASEVWNAIDKFKDKFGIVDDMECFFNVKKIASTIHELQRANREREK